MKSILLISMIIFSCSKEDKKEHCYECQLKLSGEYVDFGCMTQTEWDQFQPIDNLSNNYNKSKCREK